MTDRFFETQDLVVEIDTGATLSGHTELRLYFIYTDTDDVAAEADFKVGSVTEGTVMYAALDPLEAGTYRVWAESLNPSGKQCVSGAAFIPAEARGTVRV